MYALPSSVIVAVLFVVMVAFIDVGYRFGIRYEQRSPQRLKDHVTNIQAALLGILALLLGFTFSLALQRYDDRSEAVANEANAIGTAYLRTKLLPGAAGEAAREGLRRYVELRVDAGGVSLAHAPEWEELLEKTNESFNGLWDQATAAACENPNPVTTGLYVQALNDMADAFGRRESELTRHVPELVLFLLFVSFLMAGLVVGFSVGIAGHRPSFAAYIMVALIVLLVYTIIGLDRPRRGLLEVDHQPMIDLQSSMEPESPATTNP